MPSFNGHIASFSKGTSTGGENAVLAGNSYVNVVAAVPQKLFKSAIFAGTVSGISGGFGLLVVGSVGGATMVIAGKTAISADGSFVIGTTGGIAGVPRPRYIQYGSIADGAGFTTSIFMTGEY